MYLTQIASLGVQRIAAIWFSRSVVGAGGKLSNTLTSPVMQPIVEIVTQWPLPVCRIWTNSSPSTLNANVLPSVTLWNPWRCGNCWLHWGRTVYDGAGLNMARFLVCPDHFRFPDQIFRDSARHLPVLDAQECKHGASVQATVQYWRRNKIKRQSKKK